VTRRKLRYTNRCSIPPTVLPSIMGFTRQQPRLAECPSSAQPYGEMLGILSRDPARNLGPGVIHPECPYRVKSANQSGIIDGVPVQYRDLTAGLNDGIEFNDPVQGCVADCWLIAALSSVALVEWKEFKEYISRVPPSRFIHYLYGQIIAILQHPMNISLRRILKVKPFPIMVD